MVWYSHTLKNEPESSWEPVEDHLTSVANRAYSYAAEYGLGKDAYLAGICHDMGKYSENFQKRIKGILKLKEGEFVNHAAYGSLFLLDQGEIIPAICVAGHHTFLSLEELRNKIVPNRNSPEIFTIKESFEDIKQLFLSRNKLLDKGTLGFKTKDFGLSMDARFLFSCLVDADYTETERFMSNDKSMLRNAAVRTLNPEDYIKKLDVFLSKLPKKKLTKIRNKFRKRCKWMGKNTMDKVFSLTGETGVGKTISMISFALQYAKRFNIKRIIVVLPYTSIIEQNAKVYKDIFGEDVVLEHYMNIVKEEAETDKYKYLHQNWDAPIIVTTSVQFYETLYSNKPSKLRKLHNIADSIVIFDEAQTISTDITKPTLQAIFYMKKRFGMIPVFSTATQPRFDLLKGKIEGFETPTEIIDDLAFYKQVLKRTNIKILGDIKAGLEIDEIVSEMLARTSVLCIVNTKKQAKLLYEKLKNKTQFAYFLSTDLCVEHRFKIIKEVKERLAKGELVYLVSTQLLEAGVDISFPCVFRAIAPLTSIIQANGRNNREGEFGLTDTFVFTFKNMFMKNNKTGKYINFPDDAYASMARATYNILQDGIDLVSKEAEERFYKSIYASNNIDKKQIVENSSRYNFEKCQLDFKCIVEDSVSVLVPYEDGKILIDELKATSLWNKQKDKEATRFSVSIYLSEAEKNPNIVKVKLEKSTIYYWGGVYNKQTGINKY